MFNCLCFFLSKIFTLPLGGGKISAVKSLVAKSPNFKDRSRSAHYFAVVVVVVDVRANRNTCEVVVGICTRLLLTAAVLRGGLPFAVNLARGSSTFSGPGPRRVPSS